METVNRLSVQMQMVLEIRKTVSEHDRSITELQTRMTAMETAAESIKTLTAAVNRHTWVNQLGIWVVSLIVSSLFGLGVWFLQNAIANSP